ncbi:MAG: hypothetical protein K0R61_4768 [Microvirga sp.]|nr:hypothetical protein [Microvirga sp.]
MNKLYNATDFERVPADFYPTPPDLTRGLLHGLAQAAIAGSPKRSARRNRREPWRGHRRRPGRR